MSAQLTIRPGLPADLPAVKSLCDGTFDWGDYVPEVWKYWLDDPGGDLLVACLGEEMVGLTHVVCVDKGEAWLEGMRVHRDQRRAGVASVLTQASLEAARARGCRLARLSIDLRNLPSQGLAAKYGFMPACTNDIWAWDGTAADLAALTVPEGKARKATSADVPALAGLYPTAPLRLVHWKGRRLSRQVLRRIRSTLRVWEQGGAPVAALSRDHWDRSLDMCLPCGDPAAISGLLRSVVSEALTEGMTEISIAAITGWVPPAWQPAWRCSFRQIIFERPL